MLSFCWGWVEVLLYFNIMGCIKMKVLSARPEWGLCPCEDNTEGNVHTAETRAAGSAWEPGESPGVMSHISVGRD